MQAPNNWTGLKLFVRVSEHTWDWWLIPLNLRLQTEPMCEWGQCNTSPYCIQAGCIHSVCQEHLSFLHHYQGSIDFNTVNIHRTVWVYFLIFPGSRDGILSEMIFKDHIIQYTPCSLGSVQGNTSLGTVFLDTLPRGNIRNTSSRGKHLQCSSNDADMHNVDICRQTKCHYIECTDGTKLKQ